MATYKMTIAGLERELPICKVNDNQDEEYFLGEESDQWDVHSLFFFLTK